MEEEGWMEAVPLEDVPVPGLVQVTDSRNTPARTPQHG
jgi:hypothetical protein